MKFGKFIGFFALLAGAYLFWLLRSVVLLTFTAIAIATVLNKIVHQLRKWKFKRGWAVTITVFSILLAAVLITAIIVPPFIRQANQWIDQAPLETAQISLWIERIDNQLPPELSNQLQRLDTLIQDIPNIARSVFNNFFVFFRGTLSIFANVLFTVVITIMLLANPQAYRRIFVVSFPQFYRYRVQEILDRCETALVAWGIGISFNMVVITLMSFIGLTIIGIPLPIGNAFLAGLLTFIPNVGPILSIIPPIVLGLLEAPWKVLAVVGLYALIQQVESNFLTPIVMKKQVSLLPAVTLISQLICGILFGILGLFLALPLVVTSQVLLQELLVKDIMDNWNTKTPIPNTSAAKRENRPASQPSLSKA